MSARCVSLSSRLYQTLRQEHSLTYLVSTRLKFYGNICTFRVEADLAPRDIRRARDLILNLQRKIERYGIPDEDLKRAGQMFLANLILGLEDTLEYAGWLSSRLLRCDHIVGSKIVEEIKTLTCDDLHEKIVRLCIVPPALSLAGDLEEMEEYLPGEKIEPIQ